MGRPCIPAANDQRLSSSSCYRNDRRSWNQRISVDVARSAHALFEDVVKGSDPGLTPFLTAAVLLLLVIAILAIGIQQEPCLRWIASAITF